MQVFAVAQSAYALRLLWDDPCKGRRICHLAVRGGLTVAVLIATVLVLGESADALALVSMFYYANLIANLIFAFADFRRQWLMAFGFLLFLFCDTIIGFAMIGPYFTIPADSFIRKFFYPGFDLAWAFYLPSQMLLSVSLLPKRWRNSR